MSKRAITLTTPRGWGAAVLLCACVLLAYTPCALSTTYYLNDTNPVGDVYTLNIGNDANAGTNPAAPKLTFASLLATYTLRSGDVVKVDTGIYTNSVNLGAPHGGSASDYLAIQGSTNYADGGSVFTTPGATAFNLSAPHIRFVDLVIRTSVRGIAWSGGGLNPRIERVRFLGNTTAIGDNPGGGDHGAIIAGCLFVTNSRAIDPHSDVYGYRVDRCVFWNNAEIFRRGSTAGGGSRFHNSVLVGGAVFGDTVWYGDYNVFWSNSAIRSGYYVTIADLQRATGTNYHSTVADPHCAGSDVLDFHPMSTTGRWSGTGWVTDVVHSVLIDFGDPAADYANEPPPNGSRLNAGIYGNTTEASKSRTNAWITAISFNDGGTLFRTGSLYWVHGNVPATAKVTLAYSPDDRASWTNIVTGWAATNGAYSWDAGSVTSTPLAWWRVTLEHDTNVWDRNDTNFAVRGAGLVCYYVNDTGTADLVYTLGPGSPTNNGATPGTPKPDIQSILDSYKLGADHVIYVDTGVYTGQTTTITPADNGWPDALMVIQGSTNMAAGGTVLQGAGPGSDAVSLQGCRYVGLRDLTVRNGRYGVYFSGARDCDLESIRAVANSGGFRGDAAGSCRFRRCLAAFNTTGYGNFDFDVSWDLGVSWGNSTAFTPGGGEGSFHVSNSVIVGGTAFSGFPASGDYNVFWQTALGYTNLNEFQKARGWWHSTYADPLFANPANLDFHPQSVVGTYSNGAWPTYAHHSPCIDLGDPNAAYANEPGPNGSNVNIGIYGNTTEASKSRTNMWLQVLTYNDGGTLNAEVADPVYWRAGAYPPGATVRIELSGDTGATWQVVASNILASAGYYAWANTNFDSSRFARWRVVYESNETVYSATTLTNFTFRSGVYKYYVNDGSTVGDIYCSAPGSDSNLGTTSNSPKATLLALLAEHDVEPGDIIYIDTGFYSGGPEWVVGSQDAGDTNNHVFILGSTNTLAGGTVISRLVGGGVGLNLSGAPYMDVRDITVTNASVGLALSGSTASRVIRVTARNCGTAFSVQSSPGARLDRCVGVHCGVGLSAGGGASLFGNGVLWRCSSYGVQGDSGQVTVSNSVISAIGMRAWCYSSAQPTNITGNYNCLFADTNALVGIIAGQGRNLDTLSAWIQVVGSDTHSLSADPQFADPDRGDFHEKTQIRDGRFIPGTGWNPGWDDVTSPLIDAGLPAAAYSNEQANNGNRVNIGRYGNTDEASKGRTNAWLHAASLQEGGWMKGTSTLHWVAGGPATGHTVKAEYSPDGGETWSVLTGAGVPATNELFAWNTMATNDTPAGLWRIVSLTDGAVSDATTNFFAVRNANMVLYINDRSTSGDVYTAATGAPTNWVATVARPLDSLEMAFRVYDLEPGDLVMVDTGVFTNRVNASAGRRVSGRTNEHVRVLGSTNAAMGGSVIHAASTNAGSYGLRLDYANWMSVSNLVLRSGYAGLRVTDSSDLLFGGIRSVYNASNGIEVISSSNVAFRRVVSAYNGDFGLYGQSGGRLEWLQSVAWSNRWGAVKQAAGSLAVSNSVLEASGADSYTYVLVSNGLVRADYNDVVVGGGAYVALEGDVVSKSLIRWRERTTNDTRSLSHDPLFADPAASDFHPRSSTGRYDTAMGTFVTTDTTNSYLIDTADPLAVWTNESAPNGGRMNIGLYGNHPEASRSRTNAWLLMLTLNDGGGVAGTNDIHWVAGGAATAAAYQVYIDFSWDNGVSWTNIATNLSASGGVFSWPSDEVPSTTRGVLKIVSQSDSNVFDRTDLPFAVNNDPLAYYVNDGSTNGDVYCRTEGFALADGLSPDSPVNSISLILRRYDLRAGDTILMDTGFYEETNTISLGEAVAGQATNVVLIQGSTNLSAGGSTLDFAGGSVGLQISDTESITVRHLTLTNVATALQIVRSTNCLVEWVRAEGRSTGFEAAAAVSTRFEHCVAIGAITGGLHNIASTGTVWHSGVLWSNGVGVRLSWDTRLVQPPENQVVVSNSVIAGFGASARAYEIGSGQLQADYNDLHLVDSAVAAWQAASPFAIVHDSASRWARDATQDVHSLTADPLFASVENRDFHPKSPAGRYDPVTKTTVTVDTVISPLIDAGDRAAVYTNEPAPNGKRINIGLYGNTDEASLSPTNSFLSVVTLNDGGRAEGSAFILRWVVRGNATGHTVRLDYSANAGTNWQTIVTGIPATNESYSWNTLSFTSSLFALWKVTSEPEPAAFDQSDRVFMLRNTNFSFYVNNTGTVGSCYSTEPGSPTNSGLSANRPKDTVQGILDEWDLEPGDVVYVDTGVYTGEAASVVIGQFDAARPGDTQGVVFVGSTNFGWGGTVFDRAGGVFGVRVEQAAHVELCHIAVQGVVTSSVRVSDAWGVQVRGLTTKGSQRGFEIERSFNTRLDHCAALQASQAGLFNASSSNTVWEAGVLWGNGVGISVGSAQGGGSIRSSVGFSNSVLWAMGSNSYAYGGGGAIKADYNDIYLTGGAYVAEEGGALYSRIIDSVSRWRRSSSQDVHSLTHDPGFFDAAAGDFHPVSPTGRYSRAAGGFVFTDTNTSVLIDAGDPLAAFANETLPNGVRRNIGLFGNTHEASRSPTNASLSVITLNDGGRAEGSNFVLRWVSRGDATGHAVRIAYSADGGINWTNLITGYLSPANSFTWDTTQYTSTLRGVWGVFDEVDTNAFDISDVPFAIRNHPIPFYVNDGSQDGDVYTFAVGSSTNLGLFPWEPRDSVQGILDAWDIEGGDVIYVDTGGYTSLAPIVVGQLDAGDTNTQARVVIQGSTNYAAGGTVLDRRGGTYGVDVYQADLVELRNLSVRNAQTGVRLFQSADCVLEWVWVLGGSAGFNADQSANARFRHCVARGAGGAGLWSSSGGVTWESGVMWTNLYGIQVAGGSVSVSNSVIGVQGTNAAAYFAAFGGVRADYNNIVLISNALAGHVPASPYPHLYHTVSRWIRDYGADRRSLSHPPGFRDADAGDFHLLSTEGRYDWSVTNFVYTDTNTSVMIDAGAPAAAYGNEPPSNGGRINIGLYGNTWQASKTPTNPVLTAVSLNDGGRGEGPVTLYWVPRGSATGHTVRLEYSSDGGSSWQRIVTNQPAAASVYVWDSRGYTSSVRGVWSVTSETPGGPDDLTDSLFALRNAPLKFYVNDASTDGDVYCSAPGSAGNHGAESDAPNDSVRAIVRMWDLEPGDTVYVDTGEYLLSEPVEVDRFDAWDGTNLAMLAQGVSTNRVTFQGSTNEAAGGAVMIRTAGEYVLHLNRASGVALRDLTIRSAPTAVRADGAEYGLAEWVRCENGVIGFDLQDSDNFQMLHCVARGNSGKGLSVVSSAGTVWRHGVLWSNACGAFHRRISEQDVGSLAVENSVIGAFGSNAYAQLCVTKSAPASDYNNIYLHGGAFAGGITRGYDPLSYTDVYENVFNWWRASGQDVHTLSEEPGFANAAAGDFHLKTTRLGGRYDPVLRVWTNDTDFSRLFDSGNPASAYSAEPSPNGGRVNIGLYGNTWQASTTPTNGWVSVITLNDGGAAKDVMTLYWVAGGAAVGQLLHLDFNRVSGVDLWTNIATNVLGSVGSVQWDTTNYGRSAAAHWRVTSADDPSISATSRVPFVIRDISGSIWYFVNDSSTNGDVYCTVPGNPDYPGTTPYWPKASLQDVLNTYKLEPWDRVHVDTGEYLLTEDQRIDQLDSGSGTNLVTILGSTNWAAGGTVLNRQVSGGGTAALRLEQASGLHIRDLTLRNAAVGFVAERSEDILLENIRSLNNGQAGFSLEKSPRMEFLRCVAWANGGTNGAGLLVGENASLAWSSGVVWDNASAVRFSRAGGTSFRNSALQAFGGGRRVYEIDLNTGVEGIIASYNNYAIESGALLAEKAQAIGGNDLYASLTEWQRCVTQDVFSLFHEPYFVNEVSGDFALQSRTGRYRPDGGFTNDAGYSPMIDTGDPASAWTNEPLPNGACINIGNYGNTTNASLSPTGAWLRAISFNDGATIFSNNVLRWRGGGFTNGATVRLEFSRNGGIDWTRIATNILFSDLEREWDVSDEPVSILCLWKVVSESDESVDDEVDNLFTIKNRTLSIYINDSNTACDVYCSAPGSSFNSGLTNSAPLDDPVEAFRRYPISAGDVIYVDTGYYVISNDWTIGELNRGVTGLPIRIIGSTNAACGGSVIDRANASGKGLHIADSRFVEVSHLRFCGGGEGVRVDNSIQCSFDWVDVYSNAAGGFVVGRAEPAVMRRCAAWRNGGWGLSLGAGQVVWEQGVIWSNGLGGAEVGGALTLRNSIVHAHRSNTYLYAVSGGSVASDHGVLWISGGAQVARDVQKGFVYGNLQEWQRTTAADVHSALLDPLFADPAAGDFHLLSQTGRYSYAVTGWVADAQTSWAIDAGDPAAIYALEPLPNGARLNAGRYGNTVEASLSLTNASDRALLAVSLNDGGLVSQNKTLVWLSRGMTPADLVRLEFSWNGGIAWSVIDSNISAAAGSYFWDASAIESTPIALWRILYEADTNIADTVDRTFVLRNGPISFYVNDTNPAGDVYTDSVCAPTNSGFTRGQPMCSVQQVLDAYDVEGGDTIFVDTGIYAPSNSRFTVTALDGGVATALVYVVGSTNLAVGGTILQGGQTNVIRVRSASYLAFDHFIITNAHNGIWLEQNSSYNSFSNIWVLGDGSSGIGLKQSANNRFSRVLVTRGLDVGVLSDASSDNVLDSCVIWSNSGHAVSVSSGSIGVSNSVLYASGSTNFCYYLRTNAYARSDYNNLFVTNNARFGQFWGIAAQGLPQWTAAVTQDLFSLSVDPLFANPASNDFHLRSITGRHVAATGTWTNDAVHSYLIDTGDPTSPFDLEPLPNGGRRNIGLYGNTDQASKSRTNQWLLAITASSGGRLNGIFWLTWASGNMDPTNTVRLDYSYNNGSAWTNIAAGISATNHQYLWNSVNPKWIVSPVARWRVVLESDESVNDMTDNYFGLNGPFTFYVNDSNLVGDVWCSAVGCDTNYGIAPSEPKYSIRSVIDSYDLDAQDQVLVDTGVYPMLTNYFVLWESGDEGGASSAVFLRGSTNVAFGGTVLDRASWGAAETVFDIQARYLDMRDVQLIGGHFSAGGGNSTLVRLTFTNGNVSLGGSGQLMEDVRVINGNVSVANASGATLSRVTVGNGGMTLSGTNILVQNSLVYGGAGPAVSMEGHSAVLRNNTLAGGGTQIRKIGFGTLTLQNNIIQAQGADRFCILWEDGILSSDYNNLVATNGAWIGNRNGNWERLLYWQRESGLDLNSFSAEPLFANPAAGDYHLRSEVNRWTGTGWTNDTEHSPCIDAGSPLSSFALEPLPNGNRVNLGAYGNTPQASQSLSGPWLLVKTMNDGGVIKGTNTIRWNAGHLGVDDLVRLDYSWNNGGSWTTIQADVSAIAGQYEWNTTAFTSSLSGAWRVVLQTNDTVEDRSDQPFAVRNTPLNFYVNDSSTNGDVYCTTNGSAAFDGLTPATPKNSIQGILDAYDLEAGDTVLVDTGVYAPGAPTRIIWSRGGDDTYGNMMIRGSTNFAATGSVMTVSAALNAFYVQGSHVTIRDLTIRDALRGVYFHSNRYCSAERLLLVSNVYGIVNEYTSATTNRNIRFWGSRGGGVQVLSARTTTVEHCTFVGVSNYCWYSANSLVDVLQNSVFWLGTSNSTAFAGAEGAIRSAFIDYNVFHFAVTSSIYGGYTDLRFWQLAYSNNFRSATTNPLLANAEMGDFHLRSAAGRWLDGYGWTNDAETSWAIDRANPNSDYSREPPTNGNRANIGAYGNTEYASKGTTNVVVEVRVLNDPTIIGETNRFWPLVWTAINVPTSETFRVQFSGDGGTNWVDLATGMSPYDEYIFWPAVPYYNTYKGYWRVVGDSDTNYWDMNNALFQVIYGDFRITDINWANATNRIRWRGFWAETYQVQYSTSLPLGEAGWINAPTGGAPDQIPVFYSTHGGDFWYEDPESVGPRYRMYRVVWFTDYIPPIYVDLDLIAATRSKGMVNIVWRCTAAGTFKVQYSTTMTSWLDAVSGSAPNQQAAFFAPSAGDFSFEDVASSNAAWRSYRIHYTGM